MARANLTVDGMTCEHCVRTVTTALEQLPGVASAEVSLADHEATVTYDPTKVADDQFIAAVNDAGFQASAAKASAAKASDSPAPSDVDSAQGPTSTAGAPANNAARNSNALEHVLLTIDGMHCASCVGRVESALAAVPGVRRARVNLATEEAAVEWTPDGRATQDLLDAVHRSGYDAVVAESAARGEDIAARNALEAAGWRRRFGVAFVLFLLLLALQVLQSQSIIEAPAAGYLKLALATILMAYVGQPYLAGAWRRLVHGSTNMDTLIALGTGTAYAAGVWSLWSLRPAMYFLDASMILAFITLGKYLEAHAKGRASDAIRKLLDLSPPEATLIGDGEPRRVAVAMVAVGDTVLIRPGEKVPLDAEIESGHAALDESWLTGESMPVEKGPGDEVLAGTVNGSAALTVRVTRPAGETALAQVISLVRRAQESKADVQRLADRVVTWFVPVVLAIALVSLGIWGLALGQWSEALTACIAVLVVACPCALGLATPTAVLVGSGRGAQAGILIKEARALEIAGRLTTVVFDKTGTLTLGRPEVTDLVPTAGVTEEELLSTAAAAEQLSQHPLAECVVAAARDRRFDVPVATDLSVVPGQGIRASVAEEEILVGNERLLSAAGIDVSPLAQTVDSLRAAGRTPIQIARGDKLLGIVAMADSIAPTAAEAVGQLKAQGLDLVLLSGDHRVTAEAVARAVGIERVLAEVLPGDKEAEVRRLQASGETVAMVGDGINDAPALAAADLGIAIGSGSDIAIESADVVLVTGDVRSVAKAVALSRATLRTIRQNLVWAFLYNTLLLPVAAGLFIPWGLRLPPAAAAAAMAMSSVSVVGNSLLLRRRKLT